MRRRLVGLVALAIPLRAASEPIVGSYPCDSFVQRYWRDTNSGWAERSAVELLRDHGFEWMRFGVTMQSFPELAAASDWTGLAWQGGYWSCREVGDRALAEASAAGLRLDLMLFLSDTAAHGARQIPPTAWQAYDVPQTCHALERYCFETARHFRRQGLRIELYELGNEIERGILGFRPGERIPLPPGIDQLRNMEWMREHLWAPEAEMLKAAIGGLRRADPTARIVLHISTRPAPEDAIVVGFFEAMTAAGVPFDIAGLSYYPWIGYPSAPPTPDWRRELRGWVDGIARCSKPVLISEYSYPHHPPTPLPGMCAAPLPGYPFTPEGQAAWVREFLSWCEGHPNAVGSFYFYPDHLWRAEEPAARTEGLLALEGGRLQPLPALLAFPRW
ncbi:MAG: hypothetical protein FJX74_22670 [Armatimonadetes bacterium]|nr:hypothetical protein [Armatimonadota bacterium]